MSLRWTACVAAKPPAERSLCDSRITCHNTCTPLYNYRTENTKWTRLPFIYSQSQASET